MEDKEIEARLKADFSNTDALCEANHFESLCLWDRFHDSLTRWEDCRGGQGYMITIGEIGNRPVVVCLSFYWLNDKKVCFWYPSSQLVDYLMIRNWLAIQLKGRRLPQNDCLNFKNTLIDLGIDYKFKD